MECTRRFEPSSVEQVSMDIWRPPHRKRGKHSVCWGVSLHNAHPDVSSIAILGQNAWIISKKGIWLDFEWDHCEGPFLTARVRCCTMLAYQVMVLIYLSAFRCIQMLAALYLWIFIVVQPWFIHTSSRGLSHSSPPKKSRTTTVGNHAAGLLNIDSYRCHIHLGTA